MEANSWISNELAKQGKPKGEKTCDVQQVPLDKVPTRNF